MDSEIPLAVTSGPAAGEWLRLELLGHRVRCGLVTEVEKFGIRLARIDLFRSGDAGPVLTEFYAPAALYAAVPVSEDRARRWADESWEIRNQTIAALAPPPAIAPVEDDASLPADGGL